MNLFKEVKESFNAWKGLFSGKDKKEVEGERMITSSNPGGYGNFSQTILYTYDGEKNPGEMGIIRKYLVDYTALRNRSWQAYLDSDVAQAVLNKYVKWVIGSGLRIQTQPDIETLNDEGITFKQEATKKIEKRFMLFVNSRQSVYNTMQNLQQEGREAFKHSIVGGDMLVITRVKNNNLSIECIDGEHISNPLIIDNSVKSKKGKGNRIKNGVELDSKGTHVAYWVRENGKHTRVKARYRNGMKRAFIVYGLKYRYNNTRGLPLLSSVLESISKLDRYKEAAIGSAEERAKIPFFIEHTKDSTGENPLISSVRKSINQNKVQEGAEGDNRDTGTKLASKIATTTSKQVFNMPPESTIKAIQSDAEFNFKDFFLTNLQPLCAAIGIPVEVALSKYDSNYSASRAALKEWEHTLNVVRKYFSEQFYQPIYELWLLLEDIKGKAKVPGLFEALATKNDTVYTAYTRARFAGANVPHIDPVKEVNAERLKLGATGANIPLTTPEKATEALGEGDYESNAEKFKEQEKQAPQVKEEKNV